MSNLFYAKVVRGTQLPIICSPDHQHSDLRSSFYCTFLLNNAKPLNFTCQIPVMIFSARFREFSHLGRKIRTTRSQFTTRNPLSAWWQPRTGDWRFNWTSFKRAGECLITAMIFFKSKLFLNWIYLYRNCKLNFNLKSKKHLVSI